MITLRARQLLWLIDPGPLRGMQPVAETLGLVLTPGVVVDPEASRFKTSPTIAVGATYGRHAITNVLSKNTFFPLARQIGSTENEEWRVAPLVEVAQRGWVETGKLDGNIDLRQKPGFSRSVQYGHRLRAHRRRPEPACRRGGTGEFLANAYLGNSQLDLGYNIVNWLAGDDR